MPSDMSQRQLSGDAARLQAETRRALAAQRKSLASYSPASAASWAAPPPTTVAEALDRIAAAIHALHPGSEP